MKHKKHLLILTSLLLLTLVLSTSTVSAGAPKTYFTGVEAAIGPPTGGTLKVVDGKLHLTGVVQKAYDETNDPRTTGDVTIVVNAVWTLPDLTGPMWGTFRIENEYGAWYGRWQGRRTLEGGEIISTIQGTCHGSGEYEGLIGKWNYSAVDAHLGYPFKISGYILEPHGD